MKRKINLYDISKSKAILSTEASSSELLLEQRTKNMKTQVLGYGVSAQDIHSLLLEGPDFIFSSLHLPQRQCFLVFNGNV